MLVDQRERHVQVRVVRVPNVAVDPRRPIVEVGASKGADVEAVRGVPRAVPRARAVVELVAVVVPQAPVHAAPADHVDGRAGVVPEGQVAVARTAVLVLDSAVAVFVEEEQIAKALKFRVFQLHDMLM